MVTKWTDTQQTVINQLSEEGYTLLRIQQEEEKPKYYLLSKELTKIGVVRKDNAEKIIEHENLYTIATTRRRSLYGKIQRNIDPYTLAQIDLTDNPLTERNLHNSILHAREEFGIQNVRIFHRLYNLTAQSQLKKEPNEDFYVDDIYLIVNMKQTLLSRQTEMIFNNDFENSHFTTTNLNGETILTHRNHLETLELIDKKLQYFNGLPYRYSDESVKPTRKVFVQY